MKEDAFYHKQRLIEFIGNPLIESLPPPEDPEMYPKLLMAFPDYSENEREEKAQWRLAQLQRIAHVHLPTNADSMLLLNISRCLRWSYVDRNPIPFKDVKRFIEAEGMKVTDNQERYLTTFKAPIYGFPVLGISGVGKTTSVENVLSLFPQFIGHTKFRDVNFEAEQLVWLKVDCPSDGTPKGLCSSVLGGIDKVLGTHYTESILRNRMSKDVLLIKVSKLIRSLYLGILIIDDIQNLCGAKENVTDELLNFMVSLANNLSIPVIMVGSPKILKLLQREFQQAKRASGEGEIRMELMRKDSQEWKRFIRTIWRYQYTAKRVELSDEMEETFFNESVGNPFVVATLYKIVQDEAIISKKETFNIADVKRVSKDKMGLTANMRKNMLAGVDVELNAYKRLWDVRTMTGMPDSTTKKDTNTQKISEDTFNLLVVEVAAKLEKLLMDGNAAKSLARQAVAAFPNEKNKDVLYGYAVALSRAQATTKTKT